MALISDVPNDPQFGSAPQMPNGAKIWNRNTKYQILTLKIYDNPNSAILCTSFWRLTVNAKAVVKLNYQEIRNTITELDERRRL